MTNQSDESYYLARQAAEMLAADRAQTDIERALHLSLAERHADRAWSKAEGDEPPFA